ncbi:AAA family ATPase [bacterium]|nr:AAA family ATPase [bacterium]
MYIKNLEIDNFKSFANKAEIPLLKGFTTVSGPNGSGKSNIIDSVLFALGLANAGELRAENLSHFISTYNKRNEAFVKVTFGDVDEGGDLSISRKIRKNSQGFASTYYINDTVSSLTNVHSLLEKYNVTPNSYNVMMQGDVMWITECTSRNRRKIIDEIAGVAEFDRRIEQSTEQLNTVEQRVERASLILSEVEKMLETLKEEREVALKYQALRDEKQKYESQITKVRFFDLKRNLEQAHLNILEFTKKKKEEEIIGKDLEEKLQNLRKQYEELDKQITEKGGAEQLELKRQEETIKGDIERKNHAIDYADKQIQDGLKVITNDNNAIESNNNKINDFNLKIQLKEDEIKSIQANIKEKEDELRKINEDMTGLSDSSNLQIENRNKKRKELESLKDSEYEILQKKIPLETELKNLTEAVEKSKAEIEELKKNRENFNSDYDLKQTLVTQLEAELQDFKNIQQKTRDDLEVTKNEISDCEYKISIARKKVTSMETKKQLAQDFMGREIDTIMNAKLKGVHAPLAQLGTVDKEYSTAVEVAFGGRMAHIVVDNEHVASVAIELLLSSGAGRATFIPLNKIKPAPTKLQLPKDKGVIDYAINLVDFDDKYLDAFYYAVGDTLVVEDKECANKFIGKYRMVTLNGELYEKSGSITGGNLKKTGLSFSQNEDAELDKCLKGLKELEKQYQELIRKRDDLDRKTDILRSQYSDASEEYSKAKMELSNMKNNFDNSEKYLSEKADVIKNGEPHIKELNKKLDRLEE